MFIADNVSLDLIRQHRPLVPAIKKFDRDLADQLRRAATSVSLHLGEGRRREAGDQRRQMAHGSAGRCRPCNAARSLCATRVRLALLDIV